MQNKKRGIFILVGTLMIVSMLLAACGGGAGNGNTNANAGNNSNNESKQEDAPLSQLDRGKEIFSGLCIACHGADAKGVAGLGKNLIESEFLASSTDEEMVAFVAEGRPATHPDNTTGVDMPPRGGNPNLTDEDLLAVITYLRSLVANQ